jgi:hypothetical protein
MLANYTELQQEIADTLHRDDLAVKIPTFISLFEKRINRTLRLSEQEVTVSLTLTAGQDSVSLPADFLEPITATVLLNNYPCELISLNSLNFDNLKTVESSLPVYYTIRNGVMYFDAVADQNYTIQLHYLKRWDLATTLENWLLTNNPDLYLYGSLAAASVYIGDDSRLPLWGQLATDALREANRLSHRTRNKSPLRTELNVFQYGNNYNINKDY